MVDINRYMSDEDREALRRLAGMEHALSGGPSGPTGPVDAPGSKPMGPPGYAESQGYTARPDEVGERTAVQPHARGQDLAAPPPDAGGFGNEFQEPDMPPGGAQRPGAAGLAAPQAPPQTDPIADARERGDEAYERNMILAGVAQLFGGGGGAAQRTRQRAEQFRREPVEDARRQQTIERQQAQQQFQRRMAEEQLGVRRQQVEGTQQLEQMEAQREQAMRDPNSEMSRRAQQAVKKMFGDKIPDEVLQQMSAEELQSSGNPIMAAAKKAQAMRLKQQQFEDKREAKLEDYKKKRELAFPYDMKIARAKAALDQSEFAQELEARTEEQEKLYEKKQQDREKRYFREDVQRYAKLATKTELPTQIRMVEKAQNLARELEQETGQIFGLKDEMLRKLAPGARSAMRGKAAELQMIVNQLKNITLKDRSGAAVTKQEQERFEEELGTGLLSNEDDLKRGLENAHKYLTDRHQSIMGGFSPEVIRQYQKNYQAHLRGEQDGERDEPEEEQQSSAQPQGGDAGGEVKVRYTTPDGSRTLTMPRDDAAELRRRVQGREGYGAEVLE